jgi:hypothetical protein
MSNTNTTTDKYRHPSTKTSWTSTSPSIIEQRRATFEQTSKETTNQQQPSTRLDRSVTGRVDELRTAFETTGNSRVKDDSLNSYTSIATGLTEQRRKLFEEQRQPANHRQQVCSKVSLLVLP